MNLNSNTKLFKFSIFRKIKIRALLRVFILETKNIFYELKIFRNVVLLVYDRIIVIYFYKQTEQRNRFMQEKLHNSI